MRIRLPFHLTVLLCILGHAATARAVLLYSTATRNTDPPGSLTNREPWVGPLGADDPRRLLDSGWQWQGQFNTGAGSFLGTAISPTQFITAAHAGLGTQIFYQGQTYNVTSHIPSPNADLRIWQISGGTFSNYAPLYNTGIDGPEQGKPLVVFGRGTERAAEVRDGNGVLRGWEWGVEDHTQAWGENVVTGYEDYSTNGDNQLLYFEFNADGGPNEAALSFGDSGGGVFIQSNGVWKLAGINYAADGKFRFGNTGAGSRASIFNATGMQIELGDPPQWYDLEDNSTGWSYSTRISTNLTWIQTALGSSAPAAVPEPSSGILGILLAAGLGLRRRR